MNGKVFFYFVCLTSFVFLTDKFASLVDSKRITFYVFNLNVILGMGSVSRTTVRLSDERFHSEKAQVNRRIHLFYFYFGSINSSPKTLINFPASTTTVGS